MIGGYIIHMPHNFLSETAGSGEAHDAGGPEGVSTGLFRYLSSRGKQMLGSQIILPLVGIISRGAAFLERANTVEHQRQREYIIKHRLHNYRPSITIRVMGRSVRC